MGFVSHSKVVLPPHLFLFSCHFSALASMLCPPEWEGKECIVQIACKYACVGVIMRLFDAKKICIVKVNILTGL